MKRPFLSIYHLTALHHLWVRFLAVYSDFQQIHLVDFEAGHLDATKFKPDSLTQLT